MLCKIAYLTSADPLDKRQSSGVYYYQAQALKKLQIDLHFLGPVNNFIINIIVKTFYILRCISKKKYNTGHSILISRIYGRIFSKKLKNGDYDFVFAEKASCELAYLKTDLPVIYSTDATFNLLLNYYPEFSNFFKVSEKEGNIVEQHAINNSTLILCATEWAAKSVIKDYKFPSSRVHIIPRGANIDRIPDKRIILAKRKTSVCRLLFMGKEWYRKGYDVAYKTMDYIRSKGFPVKLVAIGCLPPDEFVDNDVELIPSLNKNTKEGIDKFEKVMFSSDFFLLPTRAECMGIAFCESAAYGLPAITRDTGGITEIVKNGINGYTLSFDSDHAEFGEKIINIYCSDEKYYNLIRSSRKYFEERLNWDVWGANLKNILDDNFNFPRS